MSGRRYLLALVVLAAALHVFAISRTLLPAQDGLKFLRIARAFQSDPSIDVVRRADQHPLYPALVAVMQPLTAYILGQGPSAWRITAQLVATLASLALLVPLYILCRALFDERIARLGVLIYVLLPLPAAVGHDTLSDSLALCAAVLALALGERALRTESWRASLGCGIAAGLGYVTRPEVVVVPVAVGLTWASLQPFRPRAAWRNPRLATLGVSFLAIVGTYALVKGEVSEKLALRRAASLGPSAVAVRKAGQWLPPGLDDPRWDFSPKEEAEEPEVSTLAATSRRLLLQWAEGLCGVFAFFAIWGVVRDRYIRSLCASNPSMAGRRLILVYLGLFSLVLARHALRMGYLSDRHTLMLVTTTIPWAAAGTFVCARGVAVKLSWSPPLAKRVGLAALLVLIASGATLQAKASHPSRWGHWAAGRWLAEHSAPSDAVLDTRGWASFVCERPSYDYWHVRQSFTDAHLAYIVVGRGELEAKSRRAETLNAVLAYAATPVAEFPERRNGGGGRVRIYRYRRPPSWEGLRP
jgi:4-amino-4-deoxy-L-arabinose transferase-like glycosyltransferase